MRRHFESCRMNENCSCERDGPQSILHYWVIGVAGVSYSERARMAARVRARTIECSLVNAESERYPYVVYVWYSFARYGAATRANARSCTCRNRQAFVMLDARSSFSLRSRPLSVVWLTYCARCLHCLVLVRLNSSLYVRDRDLIFCCFLFCLSLALSLVQ